MSVDAYRQNLLQYHEDLDIERKNLNDREKIMSPGYFPAYCWMTDKYPFVFNRSLTRKLPHQDIITDKFMSTDSYEKFLDSCAKLPDTWVYRNKNVSYKVNSLGYRNREFSEIENWKDTIAFFGCSHVFGVGLALEDSPAYLVEQQTGKEVVNFGYPAGSNELILMNIVNLCHYVKDEDFPENIVIAWTCTDRMVYFNRDIVNLGTWSLLGDVHDKNKPPYRYIEAAVEIPTNEHMKQFYLAKTARELLRGRTNLVEFSYFPTSAKYMRCDLPVYGTPEDPWDYARDLLHPGIQSSKKIANYITGKII